MDYLRFFFSKKFFKHLLAAIILVIVVIGGTFFMLNIYTDHGEELETPDFTGLTELQFTDLVKRSDLRYRIIDSVYIVGETPGVVLEQTPKAGSKVKKNRTIFFTTNSYSPESVPVPKVVDSSLRNAQATLESYGLRLGHVEYKRSQYSQLVLNQNYQGKAIDPGTMLEKGSRIDLVVGKGLDNELISMPNLTGLSLNDAIKKCESVGLVLDSKIYDTDILTAQDSADVVIWKQYPDSSEEKIHLGATVDVWLGKQNADSTNEQ